MRSVQMRTRGTPLRLLLQGVFHSITVHGPTATQLVGIGVVACCIVLPITSLITIGDLGLGPALHPVPIPTTDLGVPWSVFAQSPTAVRQDAVLALLRLLAIVAVGCLLVAMLAVAALSTLNAATGAREIAVRRAVGARSHHLLVTGLVEGGVLAAVVLGLGGVLALLVGRNLIADWPGAALPTIGPASLAVVGMILGAVMIAPVVPVLGTRRPTVERVPDRRLEALIPVTQLGVSVWVLLIAMPLSRTNPHLVRPQPTEGDGIVLTFTNPEQSAIKRGAAYASLLEGVREIGAEVISLTSPGTLAGMGVVDLVLADCGNCAVGGLPYPWQATRATHHVVSADSFEALNLDIVTGRGLRDDDRLGKPFVAVVSRSFAREHYERGDPVGRELWLVGSVDAYVVVGVVDDHPRPGFGGGFFPAHAVYLSILQHPTAAVELLVRPPAEGDIASYLPSWVAGIHEPMTAPVRAEPEGRVLAADVASLSWFGRALRLQGAGLMAITLLGVVAVMSLWMQAWTPELHLRRAIGGTRGRLLAFVLWRVLGVVSCGILLGFVLAVTTWGALAGIVSTLPRWEFGLPLCLAALVAVVSLSGAALPAFRAIRSPLTVSTSTD